MHRNPKPSFLQTKPQKSWKTFDFCAAGACTAVEPWNGMSFSEPVWGNVMCVPGNGNWTRGTSRPREFLLSCLFAAPFLCSSGCVGTQDAGGHVHTEKRVWLLHGWPYRDVPLQHPQEHQQHSHQIALTSSSSLTEQVPRSLVKQYPLLSSVDAQAHHTHGPSNIIMGCRAMICTKNSGLLTQPPAGSVGLSRYVSSSSLSSSVWKSLVNYKCTHMHVCRIKLH